MSIASIPQYLNSRDLLAIFSSPRIVSDNNKGEIQDYSKLWDVDLNLIADEQIENISAPTLIAGELFYESGSSEMSLDENNLGDDEEVNDEAPQNGAIFVDAIVTDLPEFKPLEIDNLPENNLLQTNIEIASPTTANGGPSTQNNGLFDFARTTSDSTIEIDLVITEHSAYFHVIETDGNQVFVFDEFGDDASISDFDLGQDKIDLQYFIDNSILMSFTLDDEAYSQSRLNLLPSEFTSIAISAEQAENDVVVKINGLSNLPASGQCSQEMTILVENINITDVEFTDFIY